MKKVMHILLLIVVIIIFIATNYESFNGLIVENLGEEETVLVERVIDGDTVVVEGKSIRMLGINTPEKGEKYYAEAKNYTASLVMNKTINIERRGTDLYNRTLAYLFYNEEILNSKLIEKGYANAYFPEGKDNYYSMFTNAWEECLNQNKNLCEKSQDKCATCIITKEFGYDDNLILYNSCDFDCNLTGWNLKDEGRKNFVFENFILGSNEQVKITPKDFGEKYVWTNTGDTMFLRDDKEKLVLWERY